MLEKKTLFLKRSSFNIDGDPADRFFNEMENVSTTIARYLSREQKANYNVKKPVVFVQSEDKTFVFLGITIEHDEASEEIISIAMENDGYRKFTKKSFDLSKKMTKSFIETVSEVFLRISQEPFFTCILMLDSNEDVINVVAYDDTEYKELKEFINEL